MGESVFTLMLYVQGCYHVLNTERIQQRSVFEKCIEKEPLVKLRKRWEG